jgi:hypothetical protein
LTRIISPSRLLLASLTLALAGGRAFAADQGEIGASSRGSVMITASVASRSIVSGVSDIASASATATQSVCLWSNGATRGYGLAASGDETDGALPYDVQWDGATLAAGSPREGLTATAAQPGCGKTAAGRTNLKVSFGSSSSHRNGTLTLLVIPE